MEMARCNGYDNGSITGQWIQVGRLGAGAFGVVELWKNDDKGETIAIKKSHLSIDKLSSKQKERWTNEVDIMNSLNHMNIVATRKIPNVLQGSGHGLPILCMEYCSKGDLRTVLNNYENFCGLKEYQSLRVMYDISSAVEYLHHHQITHRDLKPENIVIQQIKNRTIYKLIDLGYAKELGEDSISASIVGTMNYLAPELLWKGTYSCSVDYWSLGILFYEVITGARPFLPNMQITKTWLNYIENKDYDHICAREIDGKVNFYREIDDLSAMSQCLKNDLVHWFRAVLQWDPKKRGKAANGEELVVFNMLKSIFGKKILRIFIVPLLKFVFYPVNTSTKVSDVKKLIHNDEGSNFEPSRQMLTDSRGEILQDNDTFVKTLPEDVFMVFDSQALCDNIPKAKIPKAVEEMIGRPHTVCDYQTLRRYYGATLFFMNHELEIYRSYVLALGIIIDSCNMRLQSLTTNVEKLTLDTQLLINETEAGRTQKMKEEFKSLAKNNDELKKFSEVDWMADISEPLDKAIILLNKESTDRNRRDKPSAMVKIIFEFLQIRSKQFHRQELEDNKKNIMEFQKKLIKMEQVFKSFTAVLEHYRKEVKKCSEQCPNSLPNQMSSIISKPDVEIYDSIVIRNMIGSLLTEMDVWKRKLASLSDNDE